MPRPCSSFHDFRPEVCGICRLVATSAFFREKWDESADRVSYIPREPRASAATNEVPDPCPFRSPEPTGYCGTCGNSKNAAKYDCERFDETVALYPRKGMRDCQGCTENPTRRIALPLV